MTNLGFLMFKHRRDFDNCVCLSIHLLDLRLFRDFKCLNIVPTLAIPFVQVSICWISSHKWILWWKSAQEPSHCSLFLFRVQKRLHKIYPLKPFDSSGYFVDLLNESTWFQPRYLQQKQKRIDLRFFLSHNFYKIFDKKPVSK